MIRDGAANELVVFIERESVSVWVDRKKVEANQQMRKPAFIYLKSLRLRLQYDYF